MRNLLLFGVSSFLLVGTATAQTSECRWIGNVWTCSQTGQSRQSGIQWEMGVAPDAGQAFMDAYNRARKERDEANRAKLEAELLTAERDFYRSQTHSAQAQQSQSIVPSQSAPASSYGQAWITAAGQRRHLFKDFDKVVFAPDVRISEEMVMLMSGSPFAADIAYYLGTHKAESLAISRLSLLDAARAIDEIESRIKSDIETEK